MKNVVMTDAMQVKKGNVAMDIGVLKSVARMIIMLIMVVKVI